MGPIRVASDDDISLFAFCLFSVDSRGFDCLSTASLVDFRRQAFRTDDLRELGNTVVFFSNPPAFIERVLYAAQARKIKVAAGLVHYFDESTYHGRFDSRKPGFCKSEKYACQREYRFVLDLPNFQEQHFHLEVGDLSDIAHVVSLDDFAANLRFHLPDGFEA